VEKKGQSLALYKKCLDYVARFENESEVKSDWRLKREQIFYFSTMCVKLRKGVGEPRNVWMQVSTIALCFIFVKWINFSDKLCYFGTLVQTYPIGLDGSFYHVYFYRILFTFFPPWRFYCKHFYIRAPFLPRTFYQIPTVSDKTTFIRTFSLHLQLIYNLPALVEAQIFFMFCILTLHWPIIVYDTDHNNTVIFC